MDALLDSIFPEMGYYFIIRLIDIISSFLYFYVIVLTIPFTYSLTGEKYGDGEQVQVCFK